MPEGLSETVLPLGVLIGAVVITALLWRGDVIRPGSFRRAGLRDVSGVDGLVWLACGVGMFMAFVTGTALGSAVVEIRGLSTSEELLSGEGSLAAQSVLTWLVYAAQFAAAALMMYLLRGRVGRGSGIAWRWRDPVVGLAALALAAPAFFVLSALAQMAASLLSAEPLDPIAHETLRQMNEERGNPWFWGMAAAVVIGAPVAEEVTYRLFLQSALLRWTGSAWAAIGATSLIFGLMHASVAPWHAVVTLVVLGAMFGIAFERTKRIGVPITMHVLFNAGQIAMTLAGLHEPAAAP